MTDTTARDSEVTERGQASAIGTGAPQAALQTEARPPQAPPPAPPRRRRVLGPRWRRLLTTVAVAVTVFGVVVALGVGYLAIRRASTPAPATYFLAASKHRVVTVRWNPLRHGSARGNVTEVLIKTGGPAAEPDSIYTILTPVNVTVDGSQVTFGLATGSTFRGVLSGGSLRISGYVSVTLAASRPASYRKAVAALNTTVNAVNSAVATRLQDSTELTATQNDLAALEGDSRTLVQDVSRLGDDVTRATADLATTKSDAAQGQGYNCQNIQDTVAVDAGTVLRNDQVTSLRDDVRTLKADLKTAKAGEGTLNYDLERLNLYRVAAPSGAAGVLASAGSEVTSAVSQANADIGQVNAAVQGGYSAANALATGPCAEDGPGSPPAPQSPIG